MGSVLVVDDHPDLARALMLLLRMVGVQADCVTSGRAALDYVRANPVALVILDYMMPDLNGLEVLSQIRADERTRSIPVVLCTAVDDEEVVGKASALGAQEFLLKSALTLDKLLPVVKRYVPVHAA